MTLYPFDQLQRMRPNWAHVDRVELLMIARDAAPRTERFDATTYIFLLEGKLQIDAGGQRMMGDAGECTIVRAGESVGIAPAGENTVALRVWEKPCPPFRQRPIDASDAAPVALPPAAALPCPQNRGVHLAFALDATFQPTRIIENPRAGIFLEANPGALSAGQVREYRSITRRNQQPTVGLLLDVTDGEIERWFRDAMQAEHMELIHPLALLARADLGLQAGRRTADLIRESWSGPLAASGIRPGVVSPVRNWSEEDLLALFGWLSRVPPSTFAVVLEWTPGTFVVDGMVRAALEGMLPWIHAVHYRGSTGAAEIAHYLDGLGFQGWLLTEG